MEKSKEISVLKEKNITKTIDYVDNKKDLPKYLDKEIINNILHNIENTRDRVFISFLWMTGCRISEVLNVKKKDISFEEQIITISWLKNRKLKTRRIPLYNKLAIILKIYTSNMNLNDKLFGFTRNRGYNITMKYFNTSPHTFRHSFAVNFLRSGGKIQDLKKLLGHRHINTTMIYSELVPTDLIETMNNVDF